ncbi:MAG: DUF2096 family protein [Candidatus Bathyarchaeia archaeon]
MAIEMGYSAVWKVLEEMITDFRKKGLTVPTEIIDDLKSAKTLIKILKADPTHGETVQKIEEYLGNVESYLISEGTKNFGDKYISEWLKRLDEAGKALFAEEEEEVRFVPGLPREQKWIRVKPSAELSIERLKSLAEELNLSCNVQSDGYLLVYGEENRIKEFVKKVAIK